MDAVEIDFANAMELIQPVANIPGHDAHLGHRKTVRHQGDIGNRYQPEFVVDKGADGPVRQLRFDIHHLVADPLPDKIKIFDFVAGFSVQNDPAVFRIRPHVVNFRQGAHLGLELTGNQLFDIGRFHAGEKSGDHDFTDDNSRIFQAREGKKLTETTYDDGKNDNHCQSLGA